MAGESELEDEKINVITKPKTDTEDTQVYTKTETLREEYQHAVKELEELEEATRIEQETNRLKLQAQQAQEELQNLKLANELQRLEEKKAASEERQRLEARLKELKSGSTGPMNLSSPPMNTPGHTSSQTTTIFDKPLLKLQKMCLLPMLKTPTWHQQKVRPNHTAISENQESHGSHLKLLQNNP